MQVEQFTPQKSYQQILARQEDAVAQLLNGGPELLLLGQHSPVYTCGSSTGPGQVLNPQQIEVIETGRGGKATYHGPGQLVAYPIVNLTLRKKDLRWYIRQLQQAIVATLAEFDIAGQITDDVGVWVTLSTGEQAKIAAIGVRVRRWVTFHGLALNVAPDLAAYQGIIPCGLTKPVTSMAQLGFKGSLEEVQQVLNRQLARHLAITGPVENN